MDRRMSDWNQLTFEAAMLQSTHASWRGPSRRVKRATVVGTVHVLHGPLVFNRWLAPQNVKHVNTFYISVVYVEMKNRFRPRKVTHEKCDVVLLLRCVGEWNCNSTLSQWSASCSDSFMQEKELPETWWARNEEIVRSICSTNYSLTLIGLPLRHKNNKHIPLNAEKLIM